MTTQRKGSGCRTVALVVGAVVLAVIVGLSLLLTRCVASKRERRVHSPAETVLADGEPLTLSQDALPDYSAYQAGAPLGREAFLAWMFDRRSTTLGREAFREKAEGATVVWKLMVSDLTPSGEGISGRFVIPYHMTDGPNKYHSTTEIRAEFGPESRDSLLPVRSQDWVTVRGKLSLQENTPVIREARLEGQAAERE